MPTIPEIVDKPYRNFVMRTANEAVILQDDGRIFTKTDDGEINEIDRLEYHPGVTLTRIENGPQNNGDYIIHDFKTMKLNKIERPFSDMSQFTLESLGKNQYRIYSHPCGKDGLMNNLLFKVDEDGFTSYSDINNTGYTFKSFNNNILNNTVRRVPTIAFVEGINSFGGFNLAYNHNIDDAIFDRVTFSNDGESITIANGVLGVILITQNEILSINSYMAQFPNSFTTNALFADDGFLYIALSRSGFVIRNVYKGDYSRFKCIMEDSHPLFSKCEDVRVSNLISTPSGVWFYAFGSHKEDVFFSSKYGVRASTIEGLFCYHPVNGLYTIHTLKKDVDDIIGDDYSYVDFPVIASQTDLRDEYRWEAVATNQYFVNDYQQYSLLIANTDPDDGSPYFEQHYYGDEVFVGDPSYGVIAAHAQYDVLSQIPIISEDGMYYRGDKVRVGPFQHSWNGMATPDHLAAWQFYRCKGSGMKIPGGLANENFGDLIIVVNPGSIYSVDPYLDPSKMKLAYSNGRVFVQNRRNSVDIYDPITREPIYINPNTYSRRRIFDIVGYNENDYVIYSRDKMSDLTKSSQTTEIYMNTISSSENGLITLDMYDRSKYDFTRQYSYYRNPITDSYETTITLRTDGLPNLRRYKMALLPFDLSSATDMYNLDGDIVVARLTSNRTLSIVSFGTFVKKYHRNVPLENIVSENTRLRISRFELANCVKIEVTNLNKFCNEFYVVYNVMTGECSVHMKEVGQIDRDTDRKLITKAVSTTNLMVTEGVISGDNSISDFGANNINFNDDVYRATKTYLCYHGPKDGIYFYDKYVNRFTGKDVSIQSLVRNIPEGYSFYMGLGIGRDDCKVYIAQDQINKHRLIQEYVTNARDIVDIPIDNTKVGGIWNHYNTVQRWLIGEFNNTPVGLIYNDVNIGPKSGIAFITNLGVKEGERYGVSVTHLYDGKLDWIFKLDDYQVFDDSLSGTKLYSKGMGPFYIVIKKTGVTIVDMFAKRLTPALGTRQVRRSFTPIFRNFKINTQDYFLNATNMRQRGGWVSVRPVTVESTTLGTYSEVV